MLYCTKKKDACRLCTKKMFAVLYKEEDCRIAQRKYLLYCTNKILAVLYQSVYNNGGIGNCEIYSPKLACLVWRQALMIGISIMPLYEILNLK